MSLISFAFSLVVYDSICLLDALMFFEACRLAIGLALSSRSSKPLDLPDVVLFIFFLGYNIRLARWRVPVLFVYNRSTVCKLFFILETNLGRKMFAFVFVLFLFFGRILRELGISFALI